MYTKRIVEVQGSPMDVLVFEPQGKGPFPGLVVAQHIPVAHAGLEGDPFQIDVGERLAREGYAVAMPHFFHWWPKEADIEIKRKGFRDDRATAAHLHGLMNGDLANATGLDLSDIEAVLDGL